MGRKSIEAVDLVKRYSTYIRLGLFRKVRRDVTALDRVSFSVDRGSVFGLLGPNGAGKTTTVRILSTLLLPDSGDGYIDGFSVTREPDRVKRVLGVVLSVDKGFYGKLTGRENLVYYGMLYGLSRSDSVRVANDLLDLVGLSESRDRLYEEYSLGMKARLSIAKALIHDPDVVILDEPTLGLDPVSARKIRSVIRDLSSRGKTVMVTTHNMWEAEVLCDRIAIISSGRIIAQGSVDELKRMSNAARVVEARVYGDPSKVPPQFVVERVVDGIMYLKASLTDSSDVSVDRLVGMLRDRGFKVLALSVREPSLEDVFIDLVGGESVV